MVLSISNLKGGYSVITCLCGGNEFKVFGPSDNKGFYKPGARPVCLKCGAVLDVAFSTKIFESYSVPAEKVIVP